MKLLILTPTLGANPLLRETVASIAAVAALSGADKAENTVRHVIVTPAHAAAAVEKIAPAAQIVSERAGERRGGDGRGGDDSGGGGLYAALNAGVDGMATAGVEWDALTWINDDDRLCGPGFAQLLRKLKTSVGVGIAYGQVGLIDGRGERIGRLPVAHCGEDLAPLLARGIVPLAQPGTVIRRAAWEKLGGLDASYRLAGDLAFFVRALVTGVRFTFADAEVAEFRLRAGQLSKQQEIGAREKARALALLNGVAPAVGAHWRFRWQNRGVYAERVRRHGFVSMEQLYSRTS